MAILIVYYSRKGQNYWNGSIVDLKKGNTERVAEFIQKAVGGDLFEIETVKEYSRDYILDGVLGFLGGVLQRVDLFLKPGLGRVQFLGQRLGCLQLFAVARKTALEREHADEAQHDQRAQYQIDNQSLVTFLFHGNDSLRLFVKSIEHYIIKLPIMEGVPVKSSGKICDFIPASSGRCPGRKTSRPRF